LTLGLRFGVALDLPHGPGPVSDPRRVRSRFHDIGYTVEALEEHLRLSGELSGRATDLLVYQRRLEQRPGVVADVISLLALGLSVPERRAAEALGPEVLAMLTEAGTLWSADGSMSARIRIMPHGDLWLASDKWSHEVGDDDPLHVTGTNPPAGLLAALTVRRPVRTALDLGTGNGIQALLASAHSDSVVATDVNPRAIAFAKYNAALNDVENIEFRLGSLFEPAAGERFDLIVCNPPYVISPESGLVYRDSGAQPGALCRQVVSEIPEHLTEGGYASVLVSWPVRTGRDWSEDVRSWLSSDADAWLLKLGTDDPVTHAAEWNSPLAESDPARFAAALDQWLVYYADEQVEQINFGAVLLRGHPGSQRVVRADTARPAGGSASDQIERVFAAPADPTGATLLDRIATVASGHVFDQQLVCESMEWRLVRATLGLTGGIDVRVSLDPVMVQVVLGLDGSRTGREAVDRAAAVADLDEAGRDRLLELSAAMLDELNRRGLLET
jgi:hypothetical protein